MSLLKTIMTKNLLNILFAALFPCLFMPALAWCENAISVQAQVESTEIYVGQPFTLQLEIRGAEAVEQPTITLNDFQVIPQGGTNRSQSYQISINGKLQTTKTLSYIYQYQLTAGKPGVLSIPAIPITVAGNTYNTQPITMTVKEPEESDDFKLQVNLSKQQCYVGEPITMTNTWLIGQDLKGFEFNLPIFNDKRFELYPRQPAKGRGRTELVEIEVAGQNIVAEKKGVKRDGREYVAVTFRHTLIPRTTGKIILPKATLAVNAFDGYSQSRGRRFSRDPFDMFGSGRRKLYRTVVIPSNEAGLEILPLPSKGKPPRFSGLIGQYTILTEASPTAVNVGDPINLTVSIGGTFVDNLSLPSLEAALPSQDFKPSSDKPQSSLNAGLKTFTTTIRASHDKVTKIPGLSLPFFNPDSRKYEVARSNDIDLTVHATRVITAEDALGAGEENLSTASLETTIVSEAQQDIRPNYEDLALVGENSNSNLLYLVILILPPLLFGLVFFFDQYQHDDTRELRHRRRLAYRRFRKRLRSCKEEEMFELWLEFLGDKLGRPARSITRDDVLKTLADHKDAQEIARAVEDIFNQGEAALYGGLGHVLDKNNLLQVAKKISGVL